MGVTRRRLCRLDHYLRWLDATEGNGLYDPLLRRHRWHTAAEVGALFGFSPRAVRAGISVARAARKEIDDFPSP